MPRDASGNYTLPSGNPVVSGTTIAESWGNTTMADLAAAITNSLSRDGQGGMRVPLEFADGSAGAPGITFVTEPTLGVYRKASGVIAISGQGGDIATFKASTGNVTAEAPVPLAPEDLTRMDYVDTADAALQAQIDINDTDIDDINTSLALNWIDTDANTSGVAQNTSDIDALQQIEHTYDAWGLMNDAGVLGDNNGYFTTVRDNTGDYTITFNAAQANNDYSIQLTQDGGNPRFMIVQTHSANTITIKTLNVSQADADCAMFITLTRTDGPWANT